jgi:long-chain acyl-CoA synthetase
MKRMLFNNLRKWKGWNLLRNISTETLVITGERDNYFPRYVFDEVGKMIPDAEVYDVGASKHKVQLERYESVNRTIERFIDRTHSKSSWREQNPSAILLSQRPWLTSYGQDVPRTIPIPRQPLHKFLEGAADWAPKRTATIFFGETLTYKQLNAKVNQFAHSLHGLGVRPSDRVMIVLPNMPQFVIAYFATIKIGGVVVLPNPDANAEAILKQIQNTEAKILVTLQTNAELCKNVKTLASVQEIVLTNIEGILDDHKLPKLFSASQPNQIDVPAGPIMERIMEEASEINPDVAISHDDLATIIFTSGTTDQPKGVCLTHMNLVANALQTRHWVPGLEYGKETFLSVLPLSHSYGMTSAMNVPIAMGATLVLLPSFDLKQVLEHIKKYKPSIFPGVPSIYTAINQAPNVRNYGLSSIKACISGAAPLPVEVQESFEKLTRGKLVEGYGLTEAAPVTHANPLYGVRKIGSIGVPVPNTDAKIIDLISGNDLSHGQIGELIVKGPQVMRGYWGESNNDSNPESTIKNGWLHTGDVAVMDEDGYCTIISRKRDTIMMGDYSVYPRDVEEVLYENNKVLEVAVVGIETEGDKNQKVKAFVVPRKGTSLSKQELLDLCHRRLEAYAVPWEIEFREELPKSFVGKVLRRMLVEEK